MPVFAEKYLLDIRGIRRKLFFRISWKRAAPAILGYFLPAENATMQLLGVIGNTAFYFLPVLVAFAAGRKFGGNPFLVTAVVAILIHPNFIALTGAEGGINFLGIPVTNFDYSSSIIPAILTAWVMSYIEKLVEKITPAFTKNFLKPMLILLVSTPIAFLLLGPLGSFIGGGLASALVFIQSHVSIAAYIIMAAAMPFIVMTGMHWAFIPVVFGALDTPAGESLMLPAMLISNLAQGAACLAVAVKSKNSGLKQTAASSSVSAVFAGVTEPGLYGVTMPLKRPLAAVCISSGITGLIASIMGVSASSFASPSLLALPIFVHAEKANNFVMACICAGIAIVLTFIVTWILGFEDPAEKKADAGVYAPFDGNVETVPESHHALGLTSDGGVELLIHVGLETVRLEGRHFTCHAKEGQRIRKGDLLLEFDLKAIRTEGYDTVTPAIITNSDDYAEIIPAQEKTVKAQDTIIETA